MTASVVYLERERVALDPTMLIGTGGEAEVFDIGHGRALKLFKTPDHPDLDGSPAEQRAARERLDAHQRKLAEFPAGLPERVIGPDALARDRKRGGRIIGYAMKRVPAAELLYRYGEPRMRRAAGMGDMLVDILIDLHDTVTRVHAAGVVIGDFNDLNVLVSGRRAYLIDADSFQYGGHACAVFSERFVDPTLCDGNHGALVLVDHHRPSSDWYAFAIMVMRSLLAVGPYGGVYRPRDAADRVAHAMRPLRRITVFHPEVVYPRPAIHYSVLPDDLLDHLHAVFVADRREPFPLALLDDLRFTRCTRCGGEHARARCPRCSAGHAQQAAHAVAHASGQAQGQVRAEIVFETTGDIAAAFVRGDHIAWLCWHGERLDDDRGHTVATRAPHARATAQVVSGGDRGYLIDSGCVTTLGTGEVRMVDACSGACAGDRAGSTAFACNAAHAYWLQNGQLVRDGGRREAQSWPVIMGAVLRGQTRIWVGERFGLGFYQAGALTVGFVFDAERPGIDDRVALPRMRGAIIDVHCALGRDRAWLAWIEKRGSRTVYRCAVVDARGQVVASASGDLARLCIARGACAVGPFLFVPTDDGIVRLQAQDGRVHITRSFADTAPYVDAGTTILAGSGCLYAITGQRIVRLVMA